MTLKACADCGVTIRNKGPNRLCGPCSSARQALCKRDYDQRKAHRRALACADHRRPDELVLTPTEPGPAPGDPIGRTKGFVERVRQTHGDDFATSWLSRRTCDFTRFTIRTTPHAAATLRKRCGLIAAKLEVQIIGDPQMEIRLANANRDKALTSAGSAGMRRVQQRG